MTGSRTDLGPGALVAGRYRVGRALGEGAHGQVLLCEDLELERPVAVKVLKNPAGDPRIVQRFRREAELAVRIQHPHVVQVLDAGEAGDGTLYLVEEWIEGETLRKWLGREGPPDRELAGAWSRALLGALEAAHAAGVLHRDVKAENILVGKDGRLVLADFGLGRSTAEHTGTRLTNTGEALGTPSTLAPELLAGHDSSPAADQYSLACVLYELHYGVSWRQGKTVLDLLRRAEEPVAPLGAEPRLGRFEGIDAVLHRALQVEPERRFPSLTLMAAAYSGEVSAAVGSEGSRAPGGSLLPQVGGREPRFQFAVRTAVVLLVAAVGFLLGRYGLSGRPGEPVAASGAGAEASPGMAEALDDLERAATDLLSLYPRERESYRRPSLGPAEMLARAESYLDPRLPLGLRRTLQALARVGEGRGDGRARRPRVQPFLSPLTWLVDDLQRLQLELENELFPTMGSPEGDAIQAKVWRCRRQIEECRVEVERVVDGRPPEELARAAPCWLGSAGHLAGRFGSARSSWLLPVVEQRFLAEQDPAESWWLAQAYRALMGIPDSGVVSFERRLASIRGVTERLPPTGELVGDRLRAWAEVLKASAEVIRQPGGERHPEALAIFDELLERLEPAARRVPEEWQELRLDLGRRLQVLRMLREPGPEILARLSRLQD